MPASLSFQEPGTFVTTAWGRLTYADVKHIIDGTLQHAGFAPGSDALFDGTRVEAVPTTAELRQLAMELRPLREGGLGAIALVAGTTFTYGIARMFSMFAESLGMETAAFRSVAEAHAWLAARRAAR